MNFKNLGKIFKFSKIFFLMLPLCVFSQSNYYILLIDSSGSMKITDPNNYRHLAAQVLASLISPSDYISLIEFDTDARVLLPWTTGENKEEIIEKINKIESVGAYTDFYFAFKKAFEMFQNVPEVSAKKILLLSDGKFEPNLTSNEYRPYNREFLKVINGKTGEERRKIIEEFNKRIVPVGQRKAEEILFMMEKGKIEIYTMAFGENSDREYLKFIAEKTSLKPIEKHFFYIESPQDLIYNFIEIMSYWKDKIIFFFEKGDFYSGLEKSLFLDEFIKNPVFIFVLSNESEIKVKYQGKEEEREMPFTHKNLKIYHLYHTPPGDWKYTFLNNEGKYMFLVNGESILDIKIEGLKEKYNFGEEVKAVLSPNIKGKDYRNFFSYLEITGEVIYPDGKIKKFTLQKEKDNYILKFVPEISGEFVLKFVLYAKDKLKRDILPRPTKEYKIEILPSFYVLPSYYNFRDVKRGNVKDLRITIFSGLNKPVKIAIKNEIIEKSCKGEEKDRMPRISLESFEILPGEKKEKMLKIEIPKNGYWGDFVGNIIFLSSSGESCVLKYKVHVPSIWEKITIALILFFIIGFGILSYLSFIWGALGSPVGVLKVEKMPPSVTILDIKLGSVKKSFLKKYLNWKRHIVTISSEEGKGEIKLKGLPKDMKVELKFFRIGGKYVQNSSKICKDKKNEYIIKLKNPDIGIWITLKEGGVCEFRHGSELEIGNYKFKYMHY